MVQPTLQEISLKEVHEPFSSSSRGPIHEYRRLQIEELDEWQTHKPKTHDKPKLGQNELNTFPNQLKGGDKVLLDVVDPRTVTTKLNEEIPLTVLSIFPFGTVEGKDFPTTGYNKLPQPYDMAVGKPAKTTRVYTMSSSQGKKIAVPASKKMKGASSFLGPTTLSCNSPSGPKKNFSKYSRLNL
ncbi:hypothetical protein GOBAR_AA19120 [Gossypium barbadense]|uniref:Uncharacterized protein n=1 Tax=Gossypium barbadense TaxID=3634 RepID=A0A2P5XDX9_GOSBA|nr:hypothetical protein GOBAR_AA19120 [Gossypium barbadense]